MGCIVCRPLLQVRDWDPNRDGSISKMEWRTNIKTLLGPAGREVTLTPTLTLTLTLCPRP